MSAERTPTPWRTNIARRSDEQIIVAHVVTSDGISVAQMAAHPNEQANAEFIIRAVNSFDELVAALKYAREKAEEYGSVINFALIDAALAKAEGRS